MHPGSVVRVTICAKKTMKVAKIWQKKAMRVAKKQAGRLFGWTQGHQGGNFCKTQSIGGGSGSGKANVKMADEGGPGHPWPKLAGSDRFLRFRMS